MDILYRMYLLCVHVPQVYRYIPGTCELKCVDEFDA